MKTKYDLIISTIHLTIEEDHNLVSGTIIGSASDENLEPKKLSSDIDLLLIWRDIDNYSKFRSRLERNLNNNNLNVFLAEGWGVVSPIITGMPTIHILTDTISSYKMRSTLFRRSVAKYKEINGIPLSRFKPDTPITLDELINEHDGLKYLYETIFFKTFFIEKWVTTLNKTEKRLMKNNYATAIDHSFYGALHGARNTLRLLNHFHEFSQVIDLPQQWEEVGGPSVSTLKELIFYKNRRKEGASISRQQEERLIKNSLYFLYLSRNWIVSKQNQHNTQ